MRRIGLLLLILLLPSAAVHAFDPFFHAYGRAGDFRQGGGAQTWIPLYQGCDWVTFGEVRLLRLREQWNGSGGGGFRKIFRNTIGIGGNAFFDYSRADGAGSFWQGCAGIEIFGPCWDITANYYYPDRSAKIADTRTEFVPIVIGTEIVVDEFLIFDRVRAYRGYDINAGLQAPLCWGRIKGRAGYFRYYHHNSRTAEGPRMRLYYEVDSPFLPFTGTRWAIGGEWQYDNVRKMQAAVVLSLRFDLCTGPGIERPKPCCIPGICRRMSELVDRELGITIIRDEEQELINQQVVANIFFVEQNGMGTGTQLDPTNLMTAEANSVAGDFIFLLNNNGPIAVSSLPDDTFNMKANQTMASFNNASSVQLQIASFGTLTINDLTGAGRGILAGATMPAVTLADNNVIQGIGISGGPSGLSGTSVMNTAISSTDIVGTSVAGIDLTTSTGTTITDSGFGFLNEAIAASNLTDLSLTGNTGTFMVSGSRFENTGAGPSILINGGSATYTFSNNTINQTMGRVLEVGTTTGVGGTLTFTGGAITNTMGTGIRVDMSSAIISIANATITGATTGAVDLTMTTGSFTLDNAMISGSSFPAVSGSTVANVTIRNSIIDTLALAASTGAIDLTQASGTTTIDSNTISNISGVSNRAILISNTALGSTIAVTTNAISGASNTATGIELALAGAGATSAQINSNTLQRLTGVGITVAKTGTGGSVTSTVMSNMISNHGSSEAILMASNSNGSTYTTAVSNNIIDTASGVGIGINPMSNAAGAQTFTATVSTNTFINVMGPNRLFVDSRLATGDTLLSLLENNPFSGSAAAGAHAIRIEARTGGTLSSTLNTNTDSSGSTGSAAYSAETIAGFADTLCGDFTGNNTNNAMGIAIAGNGGTFNVAPSNVVATLMTANNGIAVTVAGATAAAASCPLPP